MTKDLWKRYRDEKTWELVSLDSERETLEEWFHNVDMLGENGIYRLFDITPPVNNTGNNTFNSEFSFRTIAAFYAWVKVPQ